MTTLPRRASARLRAARLGLTALVACAASDDEGAVPVATGDPGADVVFNEFKAVDGLEWLEIGNKGTGAVDLGGYALADTDKTTKAPKLDAKMTFPDGTRIEPGGRLLVVTGRPVGLAVGPHPKEECAPPAEAECFYATFDVSASDGETVYLLTPASAIATATQYPKSLVVDGAAGQTACRLPDLTGDFAVCAATPGAVNAP
ncbi:MAG: lamin tail domain-containing protein [Labilithrix sp.]|nr:lamin tail domain-containing protein [Labilithrix sp.]MCW5835298.1 lamin tail domain-containing protein [Labilithrix sp.]